LDLILTALVALQQAQNEKDEDKPTTPGKDSSASSTPAATAAAAEQDLAAELTTQSQTVLRSVMPPQFVPLTVLIKIPFTVPLNY